MRMFGWDATSRKILGLPAQRSVCVVSRTDAVEIKSAVDDDELWRSCRKRPFYDGPMFCD